MRRSVYSSSIIGVTKKDKHTQTSVFSFCNLKRIAEPIWVRSLVADGKPLANYSLPSPYQGAENP